MADNYSRKMVEVTSVNLLREQDRGKLPVLDVRNLGIDFGGLTAVDSFNIALGPTEICGLIGPNGAGKTTLFNLLTGVYEPTTGKVILNTNGKEREIQGKKPYNICGEGVLRGGS